MSQCPRWQHCYRRKRWRAKLEYFLCFAHHRSHGGDCCFFPNASVSEGSLVAAEDDDPLAKYRSIWLCLVGFVFAIFAFRSFCWLFYFDSENIDIQSPFNLGDLGLHLTYIKTFANGMSLWPDSPIYVYSKLRYPAGIDLFNGILTNLGFDLRPQLVATGLLASLGTFYAFYRWAEPSLLPGSSLTAGLPATPSSRRISFSIIRGHRMSLEKYPADDVCYSARPSLRHSHRSSFTLAMAGQVWIRLRA